MAAQVAPSSFEEAAQALREAALDGRSVRIRGSATKDWGAAGVPPEVELLSAGLDRMLEHNQGDLTTVLEAGVPLARAQRRFTAAGQMLALDPFLGTEGTATIGGILATGDSGPLRHRYEIGRAHV